MRSHEDTGSEGRPAANARRKPAKKVTESGYPKSPFDWYVEQQWVTEALIVNDDGPTGYGAFVWDPACGSGQVLKTFEGWCIPVHATDIQFRGYAGGKGLFQEIDFVGNLEFVASAAPKGPFSIVSNPPYSYQKGILEAFIRRALELATHKVAMLMPLGRQAGEDRHALFTQFPPARIHVLSERPSMPPGAEVEALGPKAWKRGRIDFMWVSWDVQHPTAVGDTRWNTIAPRDAESRRARG